MELGFHLDQSDQMLFIGVFMLKLGCDMAYRWVEFVLRKDVHLYMALVHKCSELFSILFVVRFTFNDAGIICIAYYRTALRNSLSAYVLDYIIVL